MSRVGGHTGISDNLVSIGYEGVKAGAAGGSGVVIIRYKFE